MEMLMKAAVSAVTGALLCLLLKREVPELSLALSLAVSALLALLAMELFAGLAEVLELAEEMTGLSPAILGPVMKCVGVGVVTRLAADLCRDAGQGAVSGTVELCGAACAVTMALPLVKSFLQMINDML